MRSLCVMVGLALCSSSVMAADFGIGVSARSDDGWVQLPIDFSKKFRVEPSLRYQTSEYEFSYDGSSPSKLDSDAWELGVGLFGLKQVGDDSRVYYGARLAYVRETTDSGILDEVERDGYRAGPAVGFEYLFGGHFSIGGELGYSFFEIEDDRGFSTNDSHGTDTRLIFRYMF